MKSRSYERALSRHLRVIFVTRSHAHASVSVSHYRSFAMFCQWGERRRTFITAESHEILFARLCRSTDFRSIFSAAAAILRARARVADVIDAQRSGGGGFMTRARARFFSGVDYVGGLRRRFHGACFR